MDLPIPPLTPAQKLGLYRNIYASRRLDDREIAGKRQNKVFFQINGAGHEAIQAAAVLVLKPSHDWFFTYYRDRALAYGMGITAYDQLLGSVGSQEDPLSGGRQMPTHWTHKELHFAPCSSPTGSQFLQAVGCAEGWLRAHQGGLSQQLGIADDMIALATSGDGTVSQGEFWEALNSAVNLRLPVLFLIQDNGYAISTPTEVQYAGANVAALLKGWEPHGLLVIDEVDGCDPEASYAAMFRAAAHCRARKGPALVRARTIRPYSHSLSDDEALYKTAAERASEQARDPVVTYAARLVQEGICSEEALADLKRSVDEEIDEAWARALAAPQPDPASVCRFLFSETVDPSSSAFDTEDSPEPDAPPKTYIDLVNTTLKAEMARDPRILVFGEDVADATRSEILHEVKGKGGVFKATHGLQRAFGDHRVYNTPLAEATIIGRALGLALQGFKPVVEIQFFDYIWPAMQQLRDEVATLRWRTHNAFAVPMVIRVPIGGYLTGGAVYHSQCGENIFAHCHGLRVVYPSSARDAAGLLRTAIRCEDPVLFLEPKHLYRQTHNKAPEPGPDFMIPFGKARTVREGKDLTVVTYGSTVVRALQAARQAQAEGIDVEILDLRTLVPLDWGAIVRSVKKTHRVLVAHEDTLSFGAGGEIAARIADDLFFELDAPVKRLGAQDAWVPYHPVLEDAMLPQPEDFLAAYRHLARI